VVQNAHEDEWELSGALREALEGMPLSPGPDRDAHLARLGPLLEEALGELERLERRGGLSPDERVMKGALEELLAASGAAERGA
jgi:hypothetical protein